MKRRNCWRAVFPGRVRTAFAAVVAVAIAAGGVAVCAGCGSEGSGRADPGLRRDLLDAIAEARRELDAGRDRVRELAGELRPQIERLWVANTVDEPLEQVRASQKWRRHRETIEALRAACEACAHELKTLGRYAVATAGNAESAGSQAVISRAAALARDARRCGREEPLGVSIQRCRDGNSHCEELFDGIESWLERKRSRIDELEKAAREL
ncbi:MAG: hypothetical protein R6V85_13330 [Polyangia bacterium]